MTAKRKLSTQIKNEKKIIAMAPGSITLRPKRSRTVQLTDGSFATIEDEAIRYECEGDRRNARTGRALDPAVPGDALIIQLFEELLQQKPWMATDVRYQIEILGEHQANRPWAGYDEQTADEARKTWEATPAAARPQIETCMKYELSKTRYDEDLDDHVSTTDPEKVAMWDDLYKLAEKDKKAETHETVDLS